MTVVTKIGCISKDQWNNIKTLSGQAEASEYTTLQSPIGTYYAPVSPLMFRVGLISYSVKSAGAIIRIGYGDTSVINSAAPPTNAVILLPTLPIEVSYKNYEVYYFLRIPTGKYPFLYSGSAGGTLILSGYEDE